MWDEVFLKKLIPLIKEYINKLEITSKMIQLVAIEDIPQLIGFLLYNAKCINLNEVTYIVSKCNACYLPKNTRKEEVPPTILFMIKNFGLKELPVIAITEISRLKIDEMGWDEVLQKAFDQTFNEWASKGEDWEGMFYTLSDKITNFISEFILLKKGFIKEVLEMKEKRMREKPLVFTEAGRFEIILDDAFTAAFPCDEFDKEEEKLINMSSFSSTITFRNLYQIIKEIEIPPNLSNLLISIKKIRGLVDELT